MIVSSNGVFYSKAWDSYYKIGVTYTDAVHPSVVAKELSDFLYHGDIPKEQTTVVSGGYGIARYTRRWLRGYRPGQIMNGAYQYGAIGPDVGYAVGVAAAVQNGVSVQAPHKGHPVICITGDAGFGYTAMEMDTLSKYRLPVIVIVYNNNAWGTWTGNRGNSKTMSIHLFQENLKDERSICATVHHVMARPGRVTGRWRWREGHRQTSRTRHGTMAQAMAKCSLSSETGPAVTWSRIKTD